MAAYYLIAHVGSEVVDVTGAAIDASLVDALSGVSLNIAGLQADAKQAARYCANLLDSPVEVIKVTNRATVLIATFTSDPRRVVDGVRMPAIRGLRAQLARLAALCPELAEARA